MVYSNQLHELLNTFNTHHCLFRLSLAGDKEIKGNETLLTRILGRRRLDRNLSPGYQCLPRSETESRVSLDQCIHKFINSQILQWTL